MSPTGVPVVEFVVKNLIPTVSMSAPAPTIPVASTYTESVGEETDKSQSSSVTVADIANVVNDVVFVPFPPMFVAVAYTLYVVFAVRPVAVNC